MSEPAGMTPAAGEKPAGQALEIIGLAKSYVPGKPVLRKVDLTIAAQGLTAIIGPSGTGKSSLLRCINRLVDPSAGQIWFSGEQGRVNLVSLRGKALPQGFLAFGEVGLAGEVRPAPRGQERLKEAAKLGFSVAVVPKANLPKKSDAALTKALEGMRIFPVERIEEALEVVRGL